MKHASNFVVRGIKQKVINNNDMITMQIISFMKKKLKKINDNQYQFVNASVLIRYCRQYEN